jgi:hypothetical protein
MGQASGRRQPASFIQLPASKSEATQVAAGSQQVLQARSCYEALPDDLLTRFALPAAGAVLCCIGICIGVIGGCLGLITAAWLRLLLLLLHWLLLLLQRLLLWWGWWHWQRHLWLW